MSLISTTGLSNRGHGNELSPIANALGMQVQVDFYIYMAMIGAAYNVRAGTISVPLVGNVPIIDTAAEMCVDAASGTTIIPVFTNVSFNLAAGTLFESAGKSVGAVSTSGTAFVPLKKRTNGSAAVATARVAATAGTVTVAAEAITTTMREWSWSQPIAAGAWPTWYDWEPRVPPVLVGPYCHYVQIGGTGTGPSYFASIDFLEGPTATLL